MLPVSGWSDQHSADLARLGSQSITILKEPDPGSIALGCSSGFARSAPGRKRENCGSVEATVTKSTVGQGTTMILFEDSEMKLYRSTKYISHWFVWGPKLGWRMFPAEAGGWSKRKRARRTGQTDMKQVPRWLAFNTGVKGGVKVSHLGGVKRDH